MFLRFCELPSELQQCVVHLALNDPDGPHPFTAMLVCKNFFTWTVPDSYRYLYIGCDRQLVRLLQTEILWPTAGGSVHHLFLDGIRSTCFPLIYKLLQMTPNLSSVLFTLEGDFTISDTVDLPKLRKVMVSGPKSEDGNTCHIHLPSKILQRLTHFAYIVQASHISTHVENDNLDDLVRWLREPFDSLSHFCVTFEDNWVALDLWEILIRDIKDRVLPLLPYQLRVFLVHGEINMSMKGALDHSVSGQVDRHIAIADIDLEDYLGVTWLAPIFHDYLFERKYRIKNHLQFSSTDPLEIWVLAEEFSSTEDGKIRAFFSDSAVFLGETVALSDNVGHEVDKLFGES
ncbi:hypothetical protein DL96DRAFT_1818945 [Flagelloscypha sp. PMI_526]|nr:hypothetical protein DL96DRAFT_1818945 [Flagelloscypha sp. PMI_526]